jgi:hypothetical protein
MVRGFRIAHMMVVVSFPVLVYSGFALKYPESWLVQPIVNWETDMDERGGVHRAAGVILMGSRQFGCFRLAFLLGHFRPGGLSDGYELVERQGARRPRIEAPPVSPDE